MISEKRAQKIRRMYQQGYGEKNICAMEGITLAELDAIVNPPAPKLDLTYLQRRVLNALHQTDVPRSAAALSGILGEPKVVVAEALIALRNLSFVSELGGFLWARAYSAFAITEAGVQALEAK